MRCFGSLHEPSAWPYGRLIRAQPTAAVQPVEPSPALKKLNVEDAKQIKDLEQEILAHRNCSMTRRPSPWLFRF